LSVVSYAPVHSVRQIGLRLAGAATATVEREQLIGDAFKLTWSGVYSVWTRWYDKWRFLSSVPPPLHVGMFTKQT